MQKPIIVSGVVNDSITDGPGLRFTLFVQGCPHRCPGCHNPETHPFEGGTPMTAAEIFESVKKNTLLKGVTLSGGEPFSQAQALLPFARMVKDANLELAAYSGFTFEEILRDKHMTELLKLCDVLVDGRYEQQLRSYELKFRGSSNQRILDVKASLAANAPVSDTTDRWN